MIYVCKKSHHATLHVDGNPPEKGIVGVGQRARLLGATADTITLQAYGDRGILFKIAQSSLDACWTAEPSPAPHAENAKQKLPSRAGQGKKQLKGGLDP